MRMAPVEDTQASLSGLIRDMKERIADLKETLKDPSKKPWDRQVDVQRQNLRRLISSALLKYPDDAFSIKLAGILWVDTSYSLIERYRKLVGEMQTKVAVAANTERPRASGRRARFSEDHDGPVALRKLVKRFVGFLDDEEKFWTHQFLLFAKAFNLPEVKSTIEELALMAIDPDDLLQNGQSTAGQGNITEGSNHKAPSLRQSDTIPTRENRLLHLSKCLISLGDLARYKAQARDPGSKPMPARGLSNRSQPAASRDYSVASEFYRHAHLLLPTDGNPSNQLAILSMYAENHFDATLHYYRAICVPRSFPTSNGNLLRSFAKHLDTSKSSNFPEGSIEHLKWQILELHSHWHLRPKDPKVDQISNEVLANLGTLIRERSLTQDTLISIFTMAVAALWTNQEYALRPGRPAPSNKADQQITESLVLAHTIRLFGALLHLGRREIDEALRSSGRESTAGNLAGHITAAFRRTLPALRIASRWLKQNMHYFVRRSSETDSAMEGTHDLRKATSAFWVLYAAFATDLHRVFPLEQLPTAKIVLDEDIELRGFLPFQDPETTSTTVGPSKPSNSSMVHPNEEHLMRLRDIQNDAREIARLEVAPIKYAGGQYQPSETSGTGSVSITLMEASGEVSEAGDTEDDSRTVSTDDPVGAAMSFALEEQENIEDEDDEQILYPRIPAESQTVTQVLAGGSPNAFPPPLSSVRASPPRSGPSGTTAEDLLSRVLGRASPSVGLARLRTGSEPSAPYLNSPLLGGRSLDQEVQLPNQTVTGSAYLQGSPSFMGTSERYKQNIPSTPFDRTVGGFGVGSQPQSQHQHQQHTRLESFSNIIPGPYSSPSLAGLAPFSHGPSESHYPYIGSPRSSNPLGAIGMSVHPGQGVVNVHDARRLPPTDSLESFKNSSHSAFPPTQTGSNGAGYWLNHRPWS